jgi:hypothetical protein
VFESLATPLYGSHIYRFDSHIFHSDPATVKQRRSKRNKGSYIRHGSCKATTDLLGFQGECI